MEALEAIYGQVSSSSLSGEVDSAVLENIVLAALQVPDHKHVGLWRFLTISGDARQNLGALYARAKLTEDSSLGSSALEKIRNKPLRAPLIVVVCVTKRAKVSEVERLLSTGAVKQNMLLAAYAQGVGAKWRVGSMAYSRVVCDGLGLAEKEKIAGCLYLGENDSNVESKELIDPGKYVTAWTAD